MKFLVTGRAEGKTTSIVQAMRWEDDSIMLVHNQTESDRIKKDYPWMKGRVIAVARSGEYLREGNYKKVYIDNLDLILPALLGLYTLDINVTATGETV